LDFGRKGGGAGFRVAQVAIKRKEWRAGADHAEVDGDAALFAKVAFGGVHQFAAQAGALACGIDAKEAEIAAIASEFDVNATREAGRIFDKQEVSLFHISRDSFGIGAIAFDERPLDAEGGVDQSGEAFNIEFLGETDVHFLQVLSEGSAAAAMDSFQQS
jgi:hypothetical protein